MLWIKYKPYITESVTAPAITTLDISETHPNQFLAFLNARPLQTAKKDEYERYIQEPVVDKTAIPSPLQWWLNPIQRSRYPNLSILALDILSIPAMAADTERLFSQAKLTLSAQRQAMDAKTLEVLQCLKSWNRSSIISTVSTPFYRGTG